MGRDYEKRKEKNNTVKLYVKGTKIKSKPNISRNL